MRNLVTTTYGRASLPTKAEIPISVQKVQFRTEIGNYDFAERDARPYVVTEFRTQISFRFITGSMPTMAHGQVAVFGVSPPLGGDEQNREFPLWVSRCQLVAFQPNGNSRVVIGTWFLHGFLIWWRGGSSARAVVARGAPAPPRRSARCHERATRRRRGARGGGGGGCVRRLRRCCCHRGCARSKRLGSGPAGSLVTSRHCHDGTIQLARVARFAHDTRQTTRTTPQRLSSSSDSAVTVVVEDTARHHQTTTAGGGTHRGLCCFHAFRWHSREQYRTFLQRAQCGRSGKPAFDCPQNPQHTLRCVHMPQHIARPQGRSAKQSSDAATTRPPDSAMARRFALSSLNSRAN